MKTATLITAFLCLITITTQAQQFFKDTNGKWGLKGAAGKIIVAGKYEGDYKPEFHDGLAMVFIVPDKDNEAGTILMYGFVDKTGKEIVPLKYQGVEEFSEDLAVVSLNNKYGYVDKTGKEVISIKYDVANDFNGGKAKVKLDGRDFYIDKTGKEVQQ